MNRFRPFLFLLACGALLATAAPASAGTASITGDTLNWIALGPSEETEGGLVYGAGQTAATDDYQVGANTGTTAGPGCAVTYFVFSQYVSCGPGSAVRHINIELGPGNDAIPAMPGTDQSTANPCLFFCGFGSFPKEPPATLESTRIDLGAGRDGGQGSAVADTIILGPGEDGFEGDDGDDLYIQGELPGSYDPMNPLGVTSGADAMDPQDNNDADDNDENDTVSYAGRTEPVSVTTALDSWPNDGEVREGDWANVESAIGGSGGDLLVGDPISPNHFTGLGGDDTIDVRDGSTIDTAECNGGTDTVVADALSEVVDACERVDLPGTPETTIDFGPADGTTIEGETASFGFSASELGSRFECAIDDGEFAPCVSEFMTPRLASGAHTVSVRATDAVAGDDASPDTDQTPASRTFAVPADTTPPGAPAIAGSEPASPANDNEPAIFGSAEGGSSVTLYASPECSGEPLASGSAQDFGDPGLTISVADDSVTSLRATATDASGNTSACSAAFDYVEDSTAQTPTIEGPASPGNDNAPAITGTAEPGSSVDLYIAPDCSGSPVSSGSAAEFASPGFTISVGDDTTTTLSAIAADLAGNVSACSGPFDYVEDSTAPETEIDAGPSGSVDSASVQFAFHSTESPATFECSLDGGAFSACGSPQGYELANGPHTFEVRASDAAGNTDQTPASRSFTVAAAPSCTITGTEAADNLGGTQGADTICGLDGNDRLRGLGGDDLLIGGAGADKLDGGRGADTLDLRDGGAGDTASCGAGADIVIADPIGSDTIAADCETIEYPAGP